MALKTVYIDMDENWVWYIPGENGFVPHNYDQKMADASVTMSTEWIEEFKCTSKRYYEMQHAMEHLYRVQEGLEPHLLTEQERKEVDVAQGNA